jgi:nitrous oxide reductase accessory protein NosL
MRTIFGFLFFSVFLISGTYALALEKVEAPESCVHCGMDRTKFAHSRMLIEYDDGTSVGLCSLNCVAIDMDSNKDKKIKSILVADYNTKKLIDTEKAFWVIGGEKKGVMTMTPKWAFENKEDADLFIKQFGGKPGTFAEALKLAKEDMRMKGMKKSGATSPDSGGKKCGCRHM